MSERHDIVIDQGADFELSVDWSNSDGSPVDMTGAVARMQVRETYSADSTLLDLDSGSKGGIALSDGTIDVTATPTQTAGLTAPIIAKYDLEVEFAGGSVRRVIHGNARIRPEVTR